MADPFLLGAGVSALSNLAGGLLGNKGGSMKGGNMRNMREAQHAAIAGKISAAKKFGISPLYALGAPTVSPSFEVGGGSNLGSTLSSMGQDVSRAVAAGKTSTERSLEQLTLAKANAEIDLLKAQTARISRETNAVPPFPGGIPEVSEDPTSLTGMNIGGYPWEFSNMMPDVGGPVQQRYGEGAEWALGLPTAIVDADYNLGRIIGTPAYWGSRAREGLSRVFDYLR